MAKYFRSAFYHPDNKDIFDFLQASSCTREGVDGFLRTYGIFCSQKESAEELHEYVSMLGFGWKSLNHLIGSANLRSTSPKQRKVDVSWSGAFEDVRSVIEAVQSSRQRQDRETYKITSEGDSLNVEVTYLEVNSAKTRVLQQVEDSLKFTVEKTAEGFAVRYESKGIAPEIVSEVLAQSKALSPEGAEISTSEIELSDILDAGKRVSFFKSLLTKIEGLRLTDVVNLRVDSFPKEQPLPDDTELDDEDLEDAVDKVIIYGTQLFQSEEFQNLVKKGFFISSLTWKAQVSEEPNDQVEIHAGFDDGKSCIGFEYKVTGVYRRDDEGKLREQKERASPAEQDRYVKRLEEAARSILNELRKSSHAQ